MYDANAQSFRYSESELFLLIKLKSGDWSVCSKQWYQLKFHDLLK